MNYCAEEVKLVKLDPAVQKDERMPMLPGAIPGAEVFLQRLEAGQTASFSPRDDKATIFLSIEGEFGFSAGAEKRDVAGRCTFIPGFDQTAVFEAKSLTRFLTIEWEIPADSRDEWKNSEHSFPYVQDYIGSVQYRDKNKSDKTISREMVRQRIVPGFCMGSVESYGYDKVAQHPHPMLDQFFFSFPENDIDVLIEDFKVPMKGDTLLHIPLGSNHGVEVLGDNHMHYIWIDFFLGQDGLDRLDNSHKPTGKMRSF
jgi:hypothetical protein